MSQAAQPDPDQELLERIRRSPEGDLRSFETLVARYQERVVANCRYLTRSADDAEDLAQEVFVKVYFGLARFEGRSAFRTWLQRIKVNHTLNHLRRHEGRRFVEFEEAEIDAPDELSVPAAAEREASARDERARIGRILDSLSDAVRIPLIMRDMDQLSYQEIADTLGLRLSAVKMRIKRGREQFRRLYRAAAADAAPEDDA